MSLVGLGFGVGRPDGARDKMLTDHVMRAHTGGAAGSGPSPMSVPAVRLGGGVGGPGSRFEEVSGGFACVSPLLSRVAELSLPPPAFTCYLHAPSLSSLHSLQTLQRCVASCHDPLPSVLLKKYVAYARYAPLAHAGCVRL